MAEPVRPLTLPHQGGTRTWPVQGKWTYEDYCRLPDDGQRYEVIRGHLYVSAAPTYDHQFTVNELSWQLNRFVREANIAYSGKPLSPHVNVRQGHRCRTQHGFLGSPVVADLDGNGGKPEIIAANMDRHVYAWDRNGDAVSGFPVLAIDHSKISAIDPATHAPTFNASAGAGSPASS